MACRYMVLAPLLMGLVACGGDRETTRGAQLFAANCVICHGADARGGGGAGVVGLSQMPPDLTILALSAGGEFPSDRVLSLLEGYAMGTQVGRKMRPFAHLNAERRQRVRTDKGRRSVSEPQADILAYLESIQRP